MNADYIYKIINSLKNLPYECILFDGPWGVGKTYAVIDALKKYDNVCVISMFGMQNSNQIYHELLFQSLFKNYILKKTAEVAYGAVDNVTEICKSLKKARSTKKVIQNVAKDKELFMLLSKSFDSQHVIVIDDLERISDKINMEEVLGIVEELKKCNYVKIILIANIEEMREKAKEVYERYSEKVIDKAYHITDKSSKINWGEMGIHDGFIRKFLEKHKVKNLRTLQKAQKFYEDVNLYIGDVGNSEFQNEIRLICFAIVVESIDKLYYIQYNNEDKIENQGIVELHNDEEYRILRYLDGVKSSKNLVGMLLRYYKNIDTLSKEQMETEYKIFVHAGNKPNYYKTDKEIESILPLIEENVDTSETIGELNRNIDEYIIWSNIIAVDNSAILEKYRRKVHDMLIKSINQGNEKILDYSYDLWHLESEEVKRIYTEERNASRKSLIQHYVEYLKNTTKGEKAFEYSYKLRQCYENGYYRNFVKDFSNDLYDKKSFPVDEIDVQQYHTCYNIMSVLYRINNEKFLKYADNLSKECDKMSAHRMKNLIDEIIRDK